MTLPASGIITATMINVELGRAANAPFSLNDPEVRALAGKPSGAISFNDFHGKSSYTREPALGDVYTLGVKEWAYPQQTGYAHIRWNGDWITGGVLPKNAVRFTSGDWTYYRGGYREYRSFYGWGIYHYFYGVWRETAGANQATYIEVREPDEGEIYNIDTRWRENVNAGAYVIWAGQESFAGTGGFSTYSDDEWVYHRGEFVEYYPPDGFNYYKIYRTRVEEWTPPPFREPETGETYSSFRRWQRGDDGTHYLIWDGSSATAGMNVDNGYEFGDWIYYKGGFGASQSGWTFFNIYRVKKAEAADTKAREPALSEAYNQNHTRWIVNETLGNSYPVWYQEAKPSAMGTDVEMIEHEGWRYHKGAYKTDVGSLKYYGVWREEL